jgi:hypothetical protein
MFIPKSNISIPAAALSHGRRGTPDRTSGQLPRHQPQQRGYQRTGEGH